MDVPGRWAGGFQAWDDDGVYLATGRGVEFGRLLQVPAADLRALMERLAAAGRAPGPRACSAPPGRSRRRSRQRESLVTLGTLSAGLAHELNNPAAAAVRTVDAMGETSTRCCTRSASSPRARSRADQFLGLDDAAAARSAAAPPVADADAAHRRRGRARRLARRPRRRRPVALASTLAAAGVDAAWCERAADLLPGGGPRARPRVGRRHPLASARCSPSCARHRPGLRARRRGALVHADGPRGAPARRRRRGPREHAGDAPPQARHGVEVVREYDADLPRDRRLRRRAQPGVDEPHRQRRRRDGRRRARCAITTRAEDDAVVVEIADTGPA